MRGIMVVNARDLQPADHHFFIFQHADAGLPDGIEEFCGACELLVIAGDEVRAQGSAKLAPGLDQLRKIHGRAVKQIACDKQDIGMQVRKFANDASKKSGVSHVSEMQVADQSGAASAPGLRQARQFHGDAYDASPCRVYKSPNSGEQPETKANRGQLTLLQMHAEQQRHSVKDPARASRQKKEIHESQPNRGDGV